MDEKAIATAGGTLQHRRRSTGFMITLILCGSAVLLALACVRHFVTGSSSRLTWLGPEWLEHRIAPAAVFNAVGQIVLDEAARQQFNQVLNSQGGGNVSFTNAVEAQEVAVARLAVAELTIAKEPTPNFVVNQLTIDGSTITISSRPASLPALVTFDASNDGERVIRTAASRSALESLGAASVDLSGIAGNGLESLAATLRSDDVFGADGLTDLRSLLPGSTSASGLLPRNSVLAEPATTELAQSLA